MESVDKAEISDKALELSFLVIDIYYFLNFTSSINISN